MYEWAFVSISRVTVTSPWQQMAKMAATAAVADPSDSRLRQRGGGVISAVHWITASQLRGPWSCFCTRSFGSGTRNDCWPDRANFNILQAHSCVVGVGGVQWDSEVDSVGSQALLCPLFVRCLFSGKKRLAAKNCDSTCAAPHSYRYSRCNSDIISFVWFLFDVPVRHHVSILAVAAVRRPFGRSRIGRWKIGQLTFARPRRFGGNQIYLVGG